MLAEATGIHASLWFTRSIDPLHTAIANGRVPARKSTGSISARTPTGSISEVTLELALLQATLSETTVETPPTMAGTIQRRVEEVWLTAAEGVVVEEEEAKK